MSVFLNTLVICYYFVFYLFMDKSIHKFFSKSGELDVKDTRFNDLKKIRVKTISEQKEFLKLQKSLGHNKITIFMINIMLVLGYIMLVSGKLENFTQGFISALLFAPVFAYAASHSVGKENREMFYFSFLNSFLFIIIFLNFVTYFETINFWLIIILFIIMSFIVDGLYKWIKGG